MKYLSDEIVYTGRRIAKRWPPFRLDWAADGNGTFTFTERGSSLGPPFCGCGVVFVAVAVVVEGWFGSPGLAWPLSAVGIVALLGGILLATSRRVLKLDAEGGDATLHRCICGANSLICTTEQVRIATCRVNLAVRWSVLPPWKGFMAVVWMTPQCVFPISAGRTHDDVERYIVELPPELRKFWIGDGPAILADY